MVDIAKGVSLEAMRSTALQREEGIFDSFKGRANTFFFKGVNGRWKGVLSNDELALYDAAVNRNLTPDAADWLEHGRAAIG
jgi:aryl sulfotransferase